jgi:putative ABC transport system permease protein
LLAARQNESLANLKDMQRQTHSFASSGGVNITPMDFTGNGEPERVHAAYVDAGLLPTLGVQPMLGRWILASEDVKGGPRNVLVSYPFWRDFLGGDPHVLGRAIRLSDKSYTVIGVMPRNFILPRELADVFVSLWAGYPEAAPERGVHFMHTYWRLKPGVSLAQAQAEIAEADHRLAAEFPDTERERGTLLMPLHERLVGNVRPALLILFGAVGLVLLIACANFAMLLMARAVARQRELMIRASLGARNGRLIRQRLTESTLLALVGGAAGLMAAKAGTTLLLALKPAELRRFDAIPMDARVWAAVRTSAGMVCMSRRYRGSVAGERTHHRHGCFAQSLAQLVGDRGVRPRVHSAGGCGIADQRLSAPAICGSGIQSGERHHHVPSAAGNPLSADSLADEFPPGVALAN